MKVNVAVIVNKMCENNLNQGQLAKGAGISVSTVSTMLNKRSNITIGTIEKVANFRGVTPGEIIEKEAIKA